MFDRETQGAVMASQRWMLVCVLLTGVAGCAGPSDSGDPPIRTASSDSVPDTGEPFLVRLQTSQGPVMIEVHPEWAPRGAARFRELVMTGYYEGCKFFRIVKGFMAQTGINGDPEISAEWKDRTIKDDPVIQSNRRGYIAFAMGGPDTRTTQLFINLADNVALDIQGFAPFGKVVEGMEIVDRLHSGYAEQPEQTRIYADGNEYLETQFPRLDFIEGAWIVEGATVAASDDAETAADARAQQASPAAAAERQARPAAADSAGQPAERKTAAQEPFRVKLATSQGDVVIEVHPEWAPRGAARFRELVEGKFYDECRVFRVLDGFMAQTGINGDPKTNGKWRDRTIEDDPVVKSNTRGYVSFATSGPDSRTTQFFINYGDNARLDEMGFSPFGKVVEGMDVVDKFYSGYGEGAPRGRGPDQQRVNLEGNAYLEKSFPKLDYIKQAVLVEDDEPQQPAAEDPSKEDPPAER
jgi:peptidyl-prolyl cis-trans isomerase A (cyclophilin A)